MWHIYILYSSTSGKTYVGYTKDVDRRMYEHHISERKGFTLRYRPWQLIHVESFHSKTEAMKREKFLKTGRGREEIIAIVSLFKQ